MASIFVYLLGYGLGILAAFFIAAAFCGVFYTLFSRFDDWRSERGYPEIFGLLAVVMLIPLVGSIVGGINAVISSILGINIIALIPI